MLTRPETRNQPFAVKSAATLTRGYAMPIRSSVLLYEYYFGINPEAMSQVPNS